MFGKRSATIEAPARRRPPVRPRRRRRPPARRPRGRERAERRSAARRSRPTAWARRWYRRRRRKPRRPAVNASRHRRSIRAAPTPITRSRATIFSALIEAIDLTQLATLDAESAREEIRDIVNEIIAIKNIVMSISEQEELLDDICNDVLGYGPLEPLLARDDIADIMVNGSGTVYIEVARQDPEDRHPLPRQPAAAEHLPAHRQPDRPPRRREPRRSATRACPTAPASTSSRRRWRSTGRRSPSASSRRTS